MFLKPSTFLQKQSNKDYVNIQSFTKKRNSNIDKSHSNKTINDYLKCQVRNFTMR